MNSDVNSQWCRREGYGGPESFPENDLAEYAIGPSEALAGQEHDLYLSDGRVLHYIFNNKTLNAHATEGGAWV